MELCGDAVHSHGSIDVIVTLTKTSVSCGLEILIIQRIAVSLNSTLAPSIQCTILKSVSLDAVFFKGKV